MHDSIIVVGMHWKVYKACMQVPLGYIDCHAIRYRSVGCYRHLV